MRNHISVASVLWLVLGTVTVVHSKFTATEKKDLMMINMNKIRNSLGTLTTQTKYLNNRPIYNCQQQGPDSLSDVAEMSLASVYIDPSNDTTSTLQQIMVSNIQNVKTNFLNLHDRLNNLSCENLTTTTTTTTTTTPETTTTTTTPATTSATTTTTTQMIESMINTTECSSTEFRCGDGICIPTYWLCDAQEDCQDCSDEENCTKDMIAAHKCPDHLFRCRLSGTCITRDWLCDNAVDCPNGEDEENCGSAGVGPTPTASYRPGDIPCEAGGLPVPNYYRCDGTTDCDNCMDEEQCVECPAEYSAVGHQCLHIDKVKRNWKEASMHCQKLGGRLAEPRDLDALSCFMKEKEGLRARYWVGGSKIKGRWLWSGGAAVPQRLLPSGAHHQSLNNRPDKNCLEIMPRRTKSPFNISNCQTKFRSLCQIDYIN